GWGGGRLGGVAWRLRRLPCSAVVGKSGTDPLGGKKSPEPRNPRFFSSPPNPVLKDWNGWLDPKIRWRYRSRQVTHTSLKQESSMTNVSRLYDLCNHPDRLREFAKNPVGTGNSFVSPGWSWRRIAFLFPENVTSRWPNDYAVSSTTSCWPTWITAVQRWTSWRSSRIT